MLNVHGLGQHGLWMSEDLPRGWECGTEEAREARLTRLCLLDSTSGEEGKAPINHPDAWAILKQLGFG